MTLSCVKYVRGVLDILLTVLDTSLYLYSNGMSESLGNMLSLGQEYVNKGNDKNLLNRSAHEPPSAPAAHVSSFPGASLQLLHQMLQ